MTIDSCPSSQKFRHPQPENIKCTNCGAEVEIWTDEAEAKCQGCKKTVRRPTGQSCLDWCKYAKECVGDELYKKYMKSKKRKGDS